MDVLTKLTDDIICDIATFCTPHDLVQLGRTCQRFGGKPGGFVAKRKKKRKSIFYSTKKRQKTTNAVSKAEVRKQKDERAKAVEIEGREWSLINEAARKIVERAKDTDEEWRAFHLSECMSLNESWIAVYLRLRQWKCTPLKFSRFVGNGTSYVEGDISHVRAKQGRNAEDSLAFCHEVMKTGKHYAEFTIITSKKQGWQGVPVGLLRPINDDARTHTKTKVKMVKSRDFPGYGYYEPLPRGYENYIRDRTEEPGFEGDEYSHNFFLPMFIPVSKPDGTKIGLLLDLDEGILAFYYKGRRRGAIKGGLEGHYRWAAFPHDCSVKIQRAPVPVEA